MSAELERLRSLLNAQPASLSEAQVDALAEAGNRAVADSLHERLCLCDGWPDACVAGHEVTTWDTGAYDTAVPAIVGLWESMRADSVPAELKRLRAEVPELRALVEAMCAAATGPAGPEPQSAHRSAAEVRLEQYGDQRKSYGCGSEKALHRIALDLRGELATLRAELGQALEDLTGANLARWEEEQDNARLRLALESAKRGRRELRSRVAELEHTVQQMCDALNGHDCPPPGETPVQTATRAAIALMEAEQRVAELEQERHTTNEALSDAAERMRADRDRIAELEAGVAWRDAERDRWADVHDLVERAIDKGWTTVDTVDLEVALAAALAHFRSHR